VRLTLRRHVVADDDARCPFYAARRLFSLRRAVFVPRSAAPPRYSNGSDEHARLLSALQANVGLAEASKSARIIIFLMTTLIEMGRETASDIGREWRVSSGLGRNKALRTFGDAFLEVKSNGAVGRNARDAPQAGQGRPRGPSFDQLQEVKHAVTGRGRGEKKP